MANRVSVEVNANVTGFQQGMNQATDSAQKYETETRKVADAQVNLMKELKAAKREVQNLAAGYAKLDDEAKKSAFGQEMAKQLEIAKQKAAEYIDLQGDLNTELKNMASDTAVFDTVADGLSALGSTMSTVTGVMGIFTDDTETMTKAITYFTTAQSIASAAIKVGNLLQKESSLMLGITKLQQMAATAAIELDTAAKGKNAVATAAATVAQKALNAAAKANPYVLLATAVLGVVSAFGLFSSGADDAEEAQRNLNREVEAAKIRMEEYSDSVYKAHMDLVKIYELMGANQGVIDEERLRAEQGMLEKLTDEYHRLHKVQGESSEDFLKRSDEALDKIRQQQRKINDMTQDIENQRIAVQQLLDTWQGLSTEKQINAAIGAFRKLRGEYQIGSKEYDELGRRIDILNKKINPPRTNRPRPSGNTNNEIQTAAGSIAALEKQISELQERAKKGALPAELQDPQKYAAKLKTLQAQLKDLKIKWDFEKPDTKLKQLENAVEEAKAQFVMAVDADDMQAQRAAYQTYQEAQRTLDKYKLSITLEPELDEAALAKQAADINETVQNALHPKAELSSTFDFSGLGNFEKLEQFQKPAQSVIDAMQRIEEARKELMEVMNSTDATDTQIATAQEGLEELNTAYQQLAEQASVYQTLSDESDKLATKNKKLAKSYNTVADCVGSVGDAFSALSKLADDDPALNIMGLIAQAVAQMFAGYASATAQAASMGPWAWVAFAAAGLAQTLAIVAQIKSAAAYAEGGIVGGSSYGGDRIMARVNSGEMILNSRQQRNLFNLLDSDTMPQKGGQQIQVSGVIRGTDLLLVQKNTNKVRSKTGTQINF